MEPHLPENKTVNHPKRFPGKLAIFLSLAILVSVGASLYFVLSKNKDLTKTLQSGLKLQKEATIKPQVVSKNPFKKDDQYVNPFDQSKSPFYNLKTAKK